MTLKKPDELFEEKIEVETPVEVEELQREGALKKPAELFEEKIEVETPVEVEVSETPEGGCATRKDQLTNVTDSSLSEEIDKNLNLLSEEYSEKLNKFNHKIDTIKEEINIKLDGIEKTNQSLKGEIGLVEYRQQTNNFDKIKKEVISEIKKLEDKIEIIKEAYEENILKEGLLNEPPSTDNSDPLTPTDQKFATLDDLNNHYQLFLNRIQKQLSTLGGGGAVNIKDMDDVDQSSARVNDKYLKYDSSSKKWVGADASGGSGIGTANVSTNSLNVIGLSTHRNGINVAGLSYLDGDVSFVGQNTNAIWDKSKSDLVLYNNTRLTLGNNEDFQMWHGGSHTFIKNTGGDLRIRGDVIKLAREDSSERYIECNVNNAVQIFHNGTERFTTTSEGVSVTGLTTTTNLIVAGVTTHNGDVIVNDDLLVTQRIRHIGDTDTYIEFTDDQIRLLAGGKGILTVTESSIDSVVINDGSNNCDFRVEGINDENLIFSDGGTDRVGIGSAIPRSKLDVVGGDIYVGYGQTTGLVLTSPNGTKYRLVVANDGTLSTTAV